MISAKNKHGLMGVFKSKNSFYAVLMHNGKRMYLGVFKSAEAAHKAYIKKKRSLIR